MYAVVADVEKYKEFVPWCQKSSVVSTRASRFVKAELEVGFNLFVERCVLGLGYILRQIAEDITHHSLLCAPLIFLPVCLMEISVYLLSEALLRLGV
jgi:Polyketide cyclase / dehydrase and lipid transport